MANWNLEDKQYLGMSDIPVFKKQRTRASSTSSPENSSQQQKQSLGRRRSSEPNLSMVEKEHEAINRLTVPNGRKRSSSHSVMPPSEVDRYFIQRNSSLLTENAKKLSQEELHSLVLDIFKPLDFYEILFDRMKNSDHQQEGEDKQE